MMFSCITIFDSTNPNQFAKATKNGKFRAYAKGCIELCEKHTKVATLSRSKLEEAPKDIKRIEVLKPNNVPSMGERYEMAIAKEKRLEVAEQPVLSESAKKKANEEKLAMERERTNHESGKKLKNEKKSKKKREKIQVNEEDLNNIEALNEEDAVEEGIDWSDSEADGSESGSESEGMDDSD